MINPIKRPMVMIGAGAALLIAASLIPLITHYSWDKFIYYAAFGIGVLVVLVFFTTAIKRAKISRI